MKPNEATNPDELLQALTQSTDEAPIVKVAVLVDALGLEEARKLGIVILDTSVSRDRCIEKLMLKKAMAELTPEQRNKINPLPPITESTENANFDSFESKDSQQ